MLLKLLLITPLILFLASCASPYPLGMNEEQWNKLSPTERQQLLLEQQKYREEQRLARIEADARARELRHQEEMAEQKRLDKLYQDPTHGNVVLVNILGGEYHHGKKVQQVREDSIELARGEIKRLELLLRNNNKGYLSKEPVYLHYAMNGGAVFIYMQNPKIHGSDQARIALLRDGHWACGSNYQKTLRGQYESLKKMRFFVRELQGRCQPSHPTKKIKPIIRH